MPKKLFTYSKSEAASARKSAAEAEKMEKAALEREVKLWKEAEDPKSRAAKKREEEAKKKAEAVVRRAEKKKLEEMEQLELENAGRTKANKRKVTEAELARRREEERLRLKRKAEEARKRLKRAVDEKEYKQMVLVTNKNRDEDVIEARTVEDAIARMAAAEAALPPYRLTERRLKAAFKAFEVAELPKFKEENPGLTLNQYKDKIRKLWKKSPRNPLNQILLVKKLPFSKLLSAEATVIKN